MRVHAVRNQLEKRAAALSRPAAARCPKEVSGGIEKEVVQRIITAGAIGLLAKVMQHRLGPRSAALRKLENNAAIVGVTGTSSPEEISVRIGCYSGERQAAVSAIVERTEIVDYGIGPFLAAPRQLEHNTGVMRAPEFIVPYNGDTPSYGVPDAAPAYDKRMIGSTPSSH